jgi:hypothetical protein
MPNEQIIPDSVHADDAELDKWLDRVMQELRGYNDFPQVVGIVSDALSRAAAKESVDEESQS